MGRKQIILFMVLIFTLSGCFRQASEPFEDLDTQPISDTSVPPVLVTPTMESDAETPQDDANDVETPQDDASDDAAQAEATENEETPALQITVETSTPILPTDAPEETIIQESPEVPPTEASEGGVETVPIATATITPTVMVDIVTPAPPLATSALSTATPDVGEVSPTPSGLVTPTSVAGEIPGECVYVVQPGDNLYRIAINNSTTLDELRAANPDIIGDLIQPGDRVNLPGCVAGTGGPVEEAATPQAEAPTVQPSGQEIYIVQPGDTLLRIAQRYGTTVTALTQANNLPDPNRLSVGQEIIIPSN